MFAALCENTEFFRQRMNGFVAMAPVVGISNAKSELTWKIARNEVLLSTIDRHLPEILPWSLAGNYLSKFIIQTNLVSATSDKIMELVADSNFTECVCPKG